MLLKKSTTALLAFFSFAILTACNNSGSSNTSTDTSKTSVQAAPADSSMQMMNDSSKMDTSKMDTASTRPVSHPH